MKAARWLGCILPAALLAAAGCSEPDAIRVLDEPKPTRPPVPPVPADKKQFRTLAAMFPRDDADEAVKKHPQGSWWFFKLSGPAAEVAPHEADFWKLVDSVRFGADPDGTPGWTLPPGWTEEKAAGGMGQYATLKAPDGKSKVAVSLARGIVLANVQRWWGQLWGPEKATEVTAVNLPDFSRLRTVHGRLAVTVDMAGPKDPNLKAGGPMANPHNPHEGK